MWQFDTRLPPVTNREDYLQTLQVFDDDTLQPINLSGISLANTGFNFTASAWTVQDGQIVTTSSTQITLPTYPITGSNNLTALTFVVGTGLGIKVGDPIQVSDTATRTNIATGFCKSYNSATGAIVVQCGWTFQFEFRRGGARNAGAGYINWWDWGTPDDLGPLLSANYSNGFLSQVDIGAVQILIPEASMATLGAIGPFNATVADSPGTYRASMTGTDGVNTRQFLIGSQPIFDGGVTT